ncbi:MAG: hypothetical protein NVSMB64_18940 [Candidatus Velthaea sp.]
MLHSFNGTDGAQPQGALVQDFSGTLYGTAQMGGPGGSVNGLAYSATTGGAVSTLHAFSGPDGSQPQSGLVNFNQTIGSAGPLHGVTSGGGTSGNGTVYEVLKSGTFRVLHSFNGTTDGAAPNGRLVRFADGNFYGTATNGGNNGNGTVFRISPAGVFTVLHTFNGSDGAQPFAGLSLGYNGTVADGKLYGTTANGGAFGGGTIFSIAPGGAFTTLFSFNPATNGSQPAVALTPDARNNLYGSASSGGPGGAGTIFKITPAGSFSLLKTFSVDINGQSPQGATPFAALAYNPQNNSLYGSTNAGGDMGYGTLFKLGCNGTFTILHSFDGAAGGQGPAGQLVLSSDGNIYGTALGGGTFNNGVLFGLPK